MIKILIVVYRLAPKDSKYEFTRPAYSGFAEKVGVEVKQNTY